MIEAAVASTAVQRPKLRGMLHAVGSAGGLPQSRCGRCAVLGLHACCTGLAAAVFVVSATVMLGTSVLYHCVTWSPRRRLWMRGADHADLFLLIAGMYTPVAWFGRHGTWRAGVLAAGCRS
jgi:hemolysin III